MGLWILVLSFFNISILVKWMSLVMDIVYVKAFEPRFGNNQYLRSFLFVYQALASQNQVQNCNIDYEDYKGYCFGRYDLTPDQAVY